MDKLIEKKEELIERLYSANTVLVNKTIIYASRKAELWLNTDFNKEFNTNRPTVDMKKAFISYYSMDEKEEKLNAEKEVEYVKYLIGLCDDKLKVCNE